VKRAALALCAAAAFAQTGPSVDTALRVYDAWTAATVHERELPGAAVGIVQDQKLVWAKGYGYADIARKEPATPATLYRIASISKLFTATAIMQLRDEGRLRLDDSVSKHLDWFHPVSRHSQGPPINLWALLTHTAGLPRESALPYWTTKQFPDREEMIHLLTSQETVYVSETQAKYSNLGVAIAGEVVAKVAGIPWGRFVEERILLPLEMRATRVRPEAGTPMLATGYGARANGPRAAEDFTDTRAIAPAANIASSVEELAKFVMLQFRDQPAGGAQVLKGATLREMHRVHWVSPDWRGGRGIGFQIRRVGSETRIGHSGSLGGYRSRIEFVAGTKIGVIALVNANDGDPDRFVDQAFSLVAPALARAAAKPALPKVADPAWEKFTGKYYWKNSEDEIMVLDGELCLVTPDAESPWETRTRLEPVAENAFLMHGGYAPGEVLTFEVDANGKVVRYRAPGVYRLKR
jgi:D-alanyl-D-alanine carboxypeptidase